MNEKLYKAKRLLSMIVNHYDDFDYDYIKKISIAFSDNNSKRINILLPAFKKKNVFGGIKTAVDFFLMFCNDYGFKARIIIVSESFDKEIIKQYPEYKCIDSMDDNDYDEITYCYIRNSRNSNNKLSVREHDVFIGTTWQSMISFGDYSTLYRKKYKKNIPIIYLIQDFEPGFYRWSSEFMLANSTYFDDNIIAVFNSHELSNYFNSHGYTFKNQYHFTPILNEKMRDKLLNSAHTNIKRENIVLFYGRPSVYRNCFSLIVKSLYTMVEKYEIDDSWKFYSIGKKHRDIKLPNGFVVKSLGKLSIVEYSELLLKSKVGISLMCSPHPSYPPLEMASFGLHTITNCYEDKNMAYFNQNIKSLKKCNFDTLCNSIYHCLNEESEYKKDYVSDYVIGKNSLSDIVTSIVNELDF